MPGRHIIFAIPGDEFTGEEKYGRERLTAEITSAKARLVGFFREFCLDLSIAGKCLHSLHSALLIGGTAAQGTLRICLSRT